MNEKLAAGGSRNGAMAAARPAGPGLGSGDAPEGAVAAAAAKKLGGIGGVGPSRPPDKLSQPSTRALKKSVRTSRFDVMPPCECPTNQNALMLFFPNWS